jgi:hypothetical protein
MAEVLSAAGYSFDADHLSVGPADPLTRHLSEEEIQERRDNAAEGIRQIRAIQSQQDKGKT